MRPRRNEDAIAVAGHGVTSDGRVAGANLVVRAKKVDVIPGVVPDAVGAQAHLLQPDGFEYRRGVLALLERSSRRPQRLREAQRPRALLGAQIRVA